jgi:elongation factor P
MISAGDFRNGVTCELDGKGIAGHRIPACQAGRARIRTHENVNVITGAVTETTFSPSESV